MRVTTKVLESATALITISGLLLLAAPAALCQKTQRADVYVSPAVEHRFFFKPGEDALARLRAAGAVRHSEDYGSFVLAIVDERLAGGRDRLFALGLQVRDDQAVVGINGMPLDTADREGLAVRLASIPERLRGNGIDAAMPGPTSPWIIQFAGPIRPAWLARLTATGAAVVTPMATNAYVVDVDGAALPAFLALRSDAAVQWIGSYLPWFRLNPALRELDLGSGTAVDVTIQLVAGAQAFELVDAFAAAGFRELRPVERVLDYVNVRIAVTANLIPALAAHPAVFGIEPLPQTQLTDEAQGQIVAGNLAPGMSGPAAPGYLPWLASKGFSQSGQFQFTVDVTDDGVDRGSVTDVNDEFKVLGAGGASRVVYAYNYTSDALPDSVRGHGNINVSIVGGYAALAGSPYQDPNGYEYGLGICPFVQLGGSKTFNNGGVGQFLQPTPVRLSAAYVAGARFSSNSWIYLSGNDYNSDSQAHDAVVRDATAASGNQEMTLIFAAGNAGSGLATVKNPGTAKNVITAGASENNRPTGQDGCSIPNSEADNAMDIALFSSRGPTHDGRTKPDIVAPGTHVQGAASRAPGYNGASVCDAYWPLGQNLYAWSSGTSHSTPAIAGAAALVRQDFLNHALATPTPAMIKACLMTSTRYMTGTGANDSLWSNSQGMGLVDLGRAFDGLQRVLVDETQVFAQSGQTYVTTGSVVSSTDPFRVALVWTDPPGPTTGNAYINNLDLQVTINGTTYLGNVFNGPLSAPGGAPDAKNNAEFVFLPAGTTGAFTVTVVATNIAGDGVPGNASVTDQDFALVVYNGTTCQAVTINAQPQSQSVCPGSPVSLSVSASGAGLTYQWRKNGTNLPGATASSYAIASASPADSGSYDVVITGSCTATSIQAVLTVVIPPAITVDPQSAGVCLGYPTTLGVTATGTALAYQWRKGGIPISGATASIFTIPSVTLNDVGSYDVVVTNACGTATSNAAILTLVGVPVTITAQPSPLGVCPGGPAAFSVTAGGSAPITYQWRKNGINIAGATAATYLIGSASPSDAGTYSVIVSNGCGPVTSGNAALTVGAPAAITTQPAGVVSCTGVPRSFSVGVTGASPLAFQWRKDGVAISGATASIYTIPSVALSDAGSYDVVVSNACATVTSNPAVLTVNPPPTIVTQPVSVTACQGSPASFALTATIMGSPWYQWRKDGNPIFLAWSATYTIGVVLPGSVGTYTCEVGGSCGSTISNGATLTLGTAASITTQPVGQAACAGAPVSLSVVAAGSGLAYQWRRNGVTLAAQTSATLAIASASAQDAGTYDVVVSGQCGPAVTSTGAVVAIAEPVISSLVPQSIAVQPPNFSPVAVSVNGSCFGPSSIVYANGVPLATTFAGPTSLSCLLTPAVVQAQLPGAICMNVQNAPSDVSNSAPLVVGSGNNAATIRRQPLAPAPGTVYSILIEGGPPLAPLTLAIDAGTVTPVTAFPNPAANFVLAVSPLTGSTGPYLVIFDGLGAYGPPSGTSFDASGTFVIPGILLPNPPLGLSATVQAVYLDPSSPVGFRLTWARFPEQL